MQQSSRKMILFMMIAALIIVALYFATRRDSTPRTSNETVNDVITIIQELDKKSAK